MAWRVFLNGNDMGEAENVQISPGQQHFTRINMLGGQSELVPGQRGPDLFQFEMDGSLDTNGNLELRDASGKSLRLMPNRIRSAAGGKSVVSGVIQPQRR